MHLFKLPSQTDGSHVKIKKIIPVQRKGSLVEMEIKDKLYVVYFTDVSATVIYREEDEEAHTTSPTS